MVSTLLRDPRAQVVTYILQLLSCILNQDLSNGLYAFKRPSLCFGHHSFRASGLLNRTEILGTHPLSIIYIMENTRHQNETER